MEKRELDSLAASIAAEMATKKPEQNALFLARILQKMDATSLNYLKVAWGFAQDGGPSFFQKKEEEC